MVTRCILLVCALLVPISFAHSAHIRLKAANEQAVAIEIAGELKPSDIDELKRVLEPYNLGQVSYRIVYLNSHGGDVATAMNIGRYLRAREFSVTVESSSLCLSSCVFILASGLFKTVVGEDIVGIHRPFGTQTGSISRDEAATMYRDLTAKIYAYLEEMNVPRALADDMLRIPPEQMRSLSFNDLERYGLSGKDLVEQEVDDSYNAERFGISRQEYLVRRTRALESCNMPPPQHFDAECYDRIMRGGSR